MLLAAILMLGLIIGSFLSVCIYRIPYGRPKGPPDWGLEEETSDPSAVGDEGKPFTADQPSSAEVGEAASPEPQEKLSLCSPTRSFCPHCKNQLAWFHNIPLFSWIALRGRCAFCKTSIPFRYPLVELLSGSAAVLSVAAFGPTLTALGVFLFCAMLIVISFIDIDYYIIPDAISIPGTILGVVVALVNQFTNLLAWPFAADLVDSLLGLAFGGGVLFLIAEVYYRVRKREGLGLGDVKLLALTGAFFGLPGALYTMFIGSLLGSVLGLLLILLSGKRMTYQLPFGPYLALGTVVYIFASPSGAPWLGLSFLGF